MNNRYIKKRWLSPAKINLFLNILKKRIEDGYHEMQTLFQFVYINDFLDFQTLEENKIIFKSNISELNNDNNLVVIAAKILQNMYKPKLGIKINLIKKIPIGGGLGGGSSNAAITLMALNWHWNLNLSKNQLINIAKTIGADVPFFIYGQSAIGEGIGNEFTPIYNLKEEWFLIGIPKQKVSSAYVFKNLNIKKNTPLKTHQELLNNDYSNDCEKAVSSEYLEIAQYLDWLKIHNPRTRLTGTGSCVYSIFSNYLEALSVWNKKPNWFNGIIVRGKNTLKFI